MFSNLLILLDYQSSTLFYSSVQHHCFATPYTITILPPLLQLHYPLCYSYTTLSATTTTLSATTILHLYYNYTTPYTLTVHHHIVPFLVPLL